MLLDCSLITMRKEIVILYGNGSWREFKQEPEEEKNEGMK